MNDLALLQRWARRRDAVAFGEIVRRHGGMVYATCLRVLGNPADAVDTAQECFVLLAEQGRSPQIHLGGWLHAVATRRALNRLRSEHRRRAREEAFAAKSGHSDDPLWDDIAEHVDEAIAALPDELRAPVVAHFMESKSHAAIARELGVPRRTVSHRIERALEAIGATLRRKGIAAFSAVLAAKLSARLAHASAPPTLAAGISKSLVAVASALPAGANASAGVGGATIAVIVLVAIAVGAVQGLRQFWPDAAAPGDESGAVAIFEEVATETSVDNDIAVDAEAALLAEIPSDHYAVATATATPVSGEVSGRVLLPDGRPYRGAFVTLTPEGEFRSLAGKATTDDNGAFTIAGVEPGDYGVGVAPPGMTVAGPTWILDTISLAAGSSVRNLRLVYGTEGDLIIAGRIVDSGGRPIAGSMVSCSGPVHRVTRSGFDGRFVLEYVADGDYEVSADVPGPYTPNVVMAKAGETDIEIVLEDRGRIEGIVVDARTGQPIREFDVTSVYGHGHRSLDFVPGMARHIRDSAGNFILENVEAGRATVMARAPGYTPGVQRVTIDGGQTLTGVVLRLDSGDTLTGTVVDAANRPIEGAEIRFQGIVRHMSRQKVAAMTNASGKFTLRNVSPEHRVVSAYYPGLAATSVEPHDGMVITLYSASALRVAVLEDGVAAPKARVSIGYLPPLKSEDSPGGLTDANGLAEFEQLTPCDARVQVELPSGRLQVADVRLEPAASHDVMVAFDRADGAVRVETNVAHLGEPADVFARLEVRQGDSTEFIERIPDAAGNIVFTSVPAGDARLQIVATFADPQRRSYWHSAFTIQSGEQVNRIFDPSGMGAVAVHLPSVDAGMRGSIGILQGRRTYEEVLALAGDRTDRAGGATFDTGGELCFPAVEAGEYTIYLSFFPQGDSASAVIVSQRQVAVVSGETATVSFIE